MKAFTDINQSLKLAEIMLSKNADMWWGWCSDPFDEVNGGEYTIEPLLHKPVCNPEKTVPCWSLAALLDVFPCSKESPIVNLTRGGWNPSFTRCWFATWEDENKNVFYSCDGTSPVDAVAELILKLHEVNLL